MCSCLVWMIERTQKTVRSAERPDSQAAGRFLMTGPDTGPHLTEVKRISTTEPRLNDRIRAQRCRLISDEGEQLGIFMVSDALRMADEQGLDLVEIAPNADSPV